MLSPQAISTANAGRHAGIIRDLRKKTVRSTSKFPDLRRPQRPKSGACSGDHGERNRREKTLEVSAYVHFSSDTGYGLEMSFGLLMWILEIERGVRQRRLFMIRNGLRTWSARLHDTILPI